MEWKQSGSDWGRLPAGGRGVGVLLTAKPFKQGNVRLPPCPVPGEDRFPKRSLEVGMDRALLKTKQLRLARKINFGYCS